MKTDKEIRCSSPAVIYGKVLFEMKVSEEAVSKTRQILAEAPRLTEILQNPTVAMRKKQSVINKVFPEEMRNFLKTVCARKRTALLEEIFVSYDRLRDEEADLVHAVLICTTDPGEEQMKGLEDFLCRKYRAKTAHIEVRREDSLIGGFILRVGSDEYDRSVKGGMDRLAQKIAGGR